MNFSIVWICLPSRQSVEPQERREMEMFTVEYHPLLALRIGFYTFHHCRTRDSTSTSWNPAQITWRNTSMGKKGLIFIDRYLEHGICGIPAE